MKYFVIARTYREYMWWCRKWGLGTGDFRIRYLARPEELYGMLNAGVIAGPNWHVRHQIGLIMELVRVQRLEFIGDEPGIRRVVEELKEEDRMTPEKLEKIAETWEKFKGSDEYRRMIEGSFDAE